ncbi:Uncharacterised protein [Yersinia rohdei]|uniref:Uncharacterized protein n=1 Tax=Yersinia rohdei TaxID=29485 RepID=A0A0U1HUS6_YERRO|nr:hypothetical protein [Yersinia rohdei]CQI92567.1 Uncharacterised protein [Yersinia rohdei]
MNDLHVIMTNNQVTEWYLTEPSEPKPEGYTLISQASDEWLDFYNSIPDLSRSSIPVPTQQ